MSGAIDLRRVDQMRMMQQQAATERLVNLAAEIFVRTHDTSCDTKAVAKKALEASWTFWNEVGPFIQEKANAENRNESKVSG